MEETAVPQTESNMHFLPWFFFLFCLVFFCGRHFCFTTHLRGCSAISRKRVGFINKIVNLVWFLGCCLCGGNWVLCYASFDFSFIKMKYLVSLVLYYTRKTLWYYIWNTVSYFLKKYGSNKIYCPT